MTRIEYVGSLPLCVANQEVSSNSPANGYVDAGSVVSFLPEVSVQHQQDILYSMLLAQLAANKAADRFTESAEWYTNYVNILENLGWSVLEMSFFKVSSTQQKIRLSEVALSRMEFELSGPEVSAVSENVEILAEAPVDSDETVVFNEGTASESAGNFQLAVASDTEEGNVSLGLGGFYFQSSKVVQSKFLFASYSACDVNFYAGLQRLTLNETIYGSIRQAIIDKLGTKIDCLVVPLCV